MTVRLGQKFKLVCDLQYGSTGKGLIAGVLAEHWMPQVVMTAWSANAGHTYIDSKRRKYQHTMVANGIVSSELQYLMIGPGSCLNLESLRNELIGIKNRLPSCFQGVLIHENAAVISEMHRIQESDAMNKIGSTKKGVGACMIEKIQRQDAKSIIAWGHKKEIARIARECGIKIVVVDNVRWNLCWSAFDRVMIEGAQGFSLGINSGFYPYVTSRECTPAQMLSDLLLPVDIDIEVIGCMRTFPIRVANRYDKDGNQIGTSGPFYDDQRELDWENDLGIQPELTTVTKLPRRIATFSLSQARDAIRAVRPDVIFLNFCNYLDNRQQVTDLISRIEGMMTTYKRSSQGVRYLGFGPEYRDVFDCHGGQSVEGVERYRS